MAAAMLAVSLLGGLGAASGALASETYTYDALGRLTSVVYDNGVIITYTYDAAGNRTAQVSTPGKAGVVALGGAFYVLPVH